MVIEGGSCSPRITTLSSSRVKAGKDVPAGTVAVVRSPLALRCSTEQNALHTLIHQRHPTPSCGGHAPTAERTLNPARMFSESLDRRPGIREQPRSKGASPAWEMHVRYRIWRAGAATSARGQRTK